MFVFLSIDLAIIVMLSLLLQVIKALILDTSLYGKKMPVSLGYGVTHYMPRPPADLHKLKLSIEIFKGNLWCFFPDLQCCIWSSACTRSSELKKYNRSSFLPQKILVMKRLVSSPTLNSILCDITLHHHVTHLHNIKQLVCHGRIDLAQLLGCCCRSGMCELTNQSRLGLQEEEP